MLGLLPRNVYSQFLAQAKHVQQDIQFVGAYYLSHNPFLYIPPLLAYCNGAQPIWAGVPTGQNDRRKRPAQTQIATTKLPPPSQCMAVLSWAGNSIRSAAMPGYLHWDSKAPETISVLVCAIATSQNPITSLAHRANETTRVFVAKSPVSLQSANLDR